MRRRQGTKEAGAVPPPSTESMKKELAELTAKKDALLAEYRTARSEVQEYETIRQNVDDLLKRAKLLSYLHNYEIE